MKSSKSLNINEGLSFFSQAWPANIPMDFVSEINLCRTNIGGEWIKQVFGNRWRRIDHHKMAVWQKKTLNIKLCEKGGLEGKSLPSLIRGLVGNIPNNPCLVISFQDSGYWLMLKLETHWEFAEKGVDSSPTHLLTHKSDGDPVQVVSSLFGEKFVPKNSGWC